jgi:tetratricopeptide (TPR) repeat protein
MFAATGVFWLVDNLRHRRTRSVVAGLFLVFGLGTVSNYDLSVLTPDTRAEYLYNMGNVAHETGDNQSAIEYLQRALERKDDLHRARYVLCLALEEENRLSEAARHYAVLTGVYPERAHFWDRLAGAQVRTGLSAEGLTSALRAIELDQEFAHAYVTAGACYLALGRTDQAIDYFSTALDLEPDELDAMNNLGVCYAQKGEFGRARQMWERVLELNPQDVEAAKNLMELRKAGL